MVVLFRLNLFIHPGPWKRGSDPFRQKDDSQEPGASFTSDPVTINVPETSPDNVVLKMNIKNIYSGSGTENRTLMTGPEASSNISLLNTAYKGELISITPKDSAGDGTITIKGKAVARSTDAPVSNSPLSLFLEKDGVDRKFSVFTDASGEFVQGYVPVAGESGVYNVRVLHPDMTVKTAMDSFVIRGLSITPKDINLNIPKNYNQEIP